MIKVEFPCTNAFCENGLIKDIYAKIHPNEESPLVTCNVCNGTGIIEASAEDLVVALNLDDISIGLVGNERMEKLTAHIRKNRR